MATSNSLEEILDKECAKLRVVETATVFVKNKDAMKEVLFKMRTAVSQIHDGIESMKQKLNEMKEQNNQSRELLALIEALDKTIVHKERNLPPELIHDYQKTKNSLSLSVESNKEHMHESYTIISANTEKQETPMRDCKKVLFNELEVCPVIRLINEDEFSKVPKYIIGRQSLETVNNLIITINEILKTKYTFLSLGKAHARKQGNLNLFLHYKRQELDICNDARKVCFFNGQDYERHTKSKLNKIKLNLITVLRHCKRLREYRVKNDLLYVVEKKN